MFRRECMKEDKKKILTAAAFLIAAGLVFGMTRSRSGIQKLDESGAVVMSGSLDADGNISWEKNGSAKSDGLPQGDSGSSTEKQEIQEPFRDENGSVQGESTVETQEYVENSEKSGVYVYICGEVAAPGVYELSEDSRIYEAVDAAGGFTENAARESVNLASKVSDGMQITIASGGQRVCSRKHRSGRNLRFRACEPEHGDKRGADDLKGHRGGESRGYYPLPRKERWL